MEDTTKITSVEDGNLTALPTMVDPPEPSKREAEIHAGAINRMDPVIYQQNIHKTTITWSTQDQPGTLLFYEELTPHKINSLVSHQADSYHYWSGDSLEEVKIAGTSFHAGMVVAVELPPHVHPTSLAGTRDYTAYNWRGIDAKNPNLEGFRIRDVRQVAFHYIDSKKNPSIHDIGGYFALYVDMPLNTSSTGTQQISIQIWSKPAPNFQLLKLKIPRLQPGEPSSALTHLVESTLDFTNNDKLPEYPSNCAYPCGKMVANSTTVTLHEVLRCNHFDTSGKSMTTLKHFEKFDRGTETKYKITGGVDNVVGGSIRVRLTPLSPFRCNRNDKGGWLYFPVIGTSTVATSWDRDINPPKDSTDWVPTLICTNSETLENAWKDGTVVYYFSAPSTTDFISDSTTIVTPNGESLITFRQEGNPRLEGLQTSRFSELCASGVLKDWIPKGQVAVFILRDGTQDLPIAKVKLYPEGFFTTRPSKDHIEYDIGKLAFSFDGFTGATNPLPKSAEYSRNKLLVLPFHSSYRR